MKDSTIRRENIRLKTELEKKTKDELKATKDKMRKTIFSMKECYMQCGVDTIRIETLRYPDSDVRVRVNYR